MSDIKVSLRSKLSMSYILLGLLCVTLISVMANYLLDKQFRAYITQNQENKNSEIVRLVGQQYSDDGTWNREVIENIGINSLEQGMIVKVKDAAGNVIWDATVHNNGLCMMMISHMSQNMMNHYSNWKGGYVENKYPVKHGLNNVGDVEIGYYGPFYYNDNDLTFINTLNKILISVGVFSLLFALLLGAFMAKRISNPISRVISTARKIAKGDFDDRSTVKSNTKEISQLTITINDLAETLEKQDNLRKRLTADVAHELRTPLATLQSHMEAMIDGIWEPEAKRLKSCHEEIMRIGRMVGDLEKLTRIESDNLILDKTAFDVMELLQHITHNFQSDFASKGVELHLSGEKAIMTADKDKISQVVINLVSNALKYTGTGGKVEITVTGLDIGTEISIKDTGKGIPQEDLPYIFERFYRADKSRNRLTGGSGIGLTIAKAIVDAHKGRISVVSQPDNGTEFKVYIPNDPSTLKPGKYNVFNIINISVF